MIRLAGFRLAGEKAAKRYRELPVHVKAAFWFFVCSFLQKGISVISTPIFTRLLTTAEYGQYSVFNSWLGIVSVFVSMNMAAGLYTQGLIKFDGERGVFSSSLQGLTLTLVCMWTVVYAVFRAQINALLSVTTTQMLLMLLMIWASAVFGFWTAEQRVLLSYRRLVIVTLIVSILKPLISALLVIHAQDKVTARIFGLALVELVGYSWCFVAQMKRGRVFFSARFWKYGLALALPLIPHYLSQTVLNGADRIMIERMVGKSEAGIYSLAYSVSMVMTLFCTALTQTLSPWIYQKIKDKRTVEIAAVAYPLLCAIALLNLLFIALAPEVIAIFAPAGYGKAIWIVPPVAMSVYFMFAYDLFAKFQFYFEKTRFIMLASAAAAAANVVLNWIFIARFGYYAAGYTTLFCYVLYTAGHYLFMRRICNQNMDRVQPYDMKTLLLITGAFLAAGFALMLSYPHRVVRYALFGALVLAAVLERKRIVGMVGMLMKARKR